MRSTLTYHPIVPGSDQHLALLERCGLSHHGRILYPALHERRLAEHRRRASALMADAARRVATKHETGPVGAEPASTTYTDSESGSGCNTECA